MSQMEPTDQLDAPNRRLPEGRVRRFANRKSVSRPPSIFLVNPSLPVTSLIRRFGSRWLWRRCFGGPQGQSQGHAVVPHRISDRSSRALGSGPEGRWFESSRHDPLKGAGGYDFASITSVAFTTAVTASPSFRCRSSALRRVITASITCAPTLTVT